MGLADQNRHQAPGGWHRVAWTTTLLLALVPLMQLLVLGSHGRLMGDDFCHLVSGLEYGPLGNVLFWRNSLNGSFSFYFVHGLVAPLDTLAAGAVVVVIVAVWPLGLAWMIRAGHRLFGRDRPPLAPSVMVAAALVWLTIHGLVSPLSIWSYSSAMRHTLPVALLMLALAACCEFIPRARSFRGLASACAIFALFAFFNAGMSEVFATVQLTLFSTMVPLVSVLVPREFRRKSALLAASGWAATVAALLVMATATGVANRLAMLGLDLRSPLQNREDLYAKLLEHIHVFFVDADLHAAFIGALAICLYSFLTVRRKTPSAAMPTPFQLAAPPLVLCLLAQLLLFPTVWAKQSDSLLLFGRIRLVDLVAGVHLTLLAGVALILLARRSINAHLLKRRDFWAAIPALTLGVVILLFGLSQYQHITLEAASFFSGSAYTLLFALVWQFHFHFLATGKNRQFLKAFVWVFIVTGASTLALVVLNQAIGGKQYVYNLSFMSFAFAFSGFSCGIALAYAINQVNASFPFANRTTLAIAYGSGIVAIAVWFGIVSGNAESVPQFERFSRAWDERHAMILAKRNGGERLAESPRLADDILEIPGGFRGYDYWESSCGSDELTALIEKRYRA